MGVAWSFSPILWCFLASALNRLTHTEGGGREGGREGEGEGGRERGRERGREGGGREREEGVNLTVQFGY